MRYRPWAESEHYINPPNARSIYVRTKVSVASKPAGTMFRAPASEFGGTAEGDRSRTDFIRLR
jgi:hypothetical protein